MSVEREEPDELDDLPEPDGSEDDVEDGASSDASFEVPLLDEQDALDRDDSSAYDLDIGMELDVGAEQIDSIEESELVLDIGDLLAPEDEHTRHDDDAAGPTDFDVTSDLRDLDESTHEEDEQQGGDFGELSEKDLPDLDSDDADVPEPSPALWSDSEILNDEPAAPWSTQTLLEQVLPFEAAACNVITRTRNKLLAGGRELLVLQHGKPAARLPAAGAPVTNAVLLGAELSVVMYVTASGRLWRHASGGAEPCEAWRAEAGVATSQTVYLELCRAGDDYPNRIFLRTSRGALLRSDDLGATFTRVDLGGPVSSVTASSRHLFALVGSGANSRLVRSRDGGVSFTQTALDRAAAVIATADSPKLRAEASTLALFDEQRGLVVSYDAGRQFVRIAGCTNATAATIGMVAGTPAIWVSVFEETTERAFILRIAGHSAERIAEVPSPGGGRTEELGEAFRVHDLCWDFDNDALWAAGNFGLLCWLLPNE